MILDAKIDFSAIGFLLVIVAVVAAAVNLSITLVGQVGSS